jgi:hypothetical protein
MDLKAASVSIIHRLFDPPFNDQQGCIFTRIGRRFVCRIHQVIIAKLQDTCQVPTTEFKLAPCDSKIFPVSRTVSVVATNAVVATKAVVATVPSVASTIVYKSEKEAYVDYLALKEKTVIASVVNIPATIGLFSSPSTSPVIASLSAAVELMHID